MQQRCPSCNRAWVPGEMSCPFCGATLGAAPPAGAAFQLQWAGRGGTPRSQVLPPQGLRLGRGRGNDLVLNDTMVSREHAAMWIQGGECFIRDAGSKNGTIVNGQRIAGDVRLQPGDQIVIGQTVFQLAVGAVPAVAPFPGPAAPAPYQPAPVAHAASPYQPAPVPPGFPPPQAPQPFPAAARPSPQAGAFTVGRGITLAGVLAILLMFFMPWVSCTGTSITASGYEIATTPSLSDLGIQSIIAYQGPALPPALLFLLPGIGIVVLGLAIAALFVQAGKQLPLLIVQVALAVAVLAMLVWFYIDTSSARGLLSLQIGYWGSWAAALLMIAGAVLDILGVGGRYPPA